MKKPYDLTLNTDFQNKLNTIFEEFIIDAEKLKPYVYKFQNEENNPIFSIKEYLFEIFALGVFWNLYSPLANQNTYILKSAKKLCLYKNTTFIKNIIYKKFIGIFHTYFYNNQKNLTLSLENYKKTLILISSVSDLKELSTRLELWINFIEKYRIFDEIFPLINGFSEDFILKNKKIFEKEFKEFETFRVTSLKNKKFKEDFLFGQMTFDEYLLNLLGAQIMNHSMENIGNSYKKVIALPSCLCLLQNSCKKIEFKGLYKCSFCTTKCAVAKLSKKYPDTFIIPHSVEFKNAVKLFKTMGNIKILGIACIGNLLSGGYGLKRAGLISQCVILDYPGCTHFYKNPIVTNICLETVDKIMENHSF